MLDREEFVRWRDEATRALEVARGAGAAGFFNWACFAAEQAAQLAVKAVLHGIGTGPWGHDLDSLRVMAQDAGLEVPGDIEDALRRLGRHHNAARDPHAHAAGSPASHYGEADWLQAERDATAALGFVDDAWAGLS